MKSPWTLKHVCSIQNKLFFIFIYLFTFIISVRPSSLLSDKQLCADQNCQVPISVATTVQKYLSPERGLLTLPSNVDVYVYSKSAGKNTDLWGVEFKGKRGYVPARFLRENRILQKELKFTVPVEAADNLTETNTKHGKNNKDKKKLLQEENKTEKIILSGEDVEFENLNELYDKNEIEVNDTQDNSELNVPSEQKEDIQGENTKDNKILDKKEDSENVEIDINKDENILKTEDEEEHEDQEESEVEEDEDDEEEDDDNEEEIVDTEKETEMFKDVRIEGNLKNEKEIIPVEDSNETKDSQTDPIPEEKKSEDVTPENVESTTGKSVTETIYDKVTVQETITEEIVLESASISPTESSSDEDLLVIDGTTIFLNDMSDIEATTELPNDHLQSSVAELSTDIPADTPTDNLSSYVTEPTEVVQDKETEISDETAEEISPTESVSADGWFPSITAFTENLFGTEESDSDKEEIMEENDSEKSEFDEINVKTDEEKPETVEEIENENQEEKTENIENNNENQSIEEIPGTESNIEDKNTQENSYLEENSSEVIENKDNLEAKEENLQMENSNPNIVTDAPKIIDAPPTTGFFGSLLGGSYENPPEPSKTEEIESTTEESNNTDDELGNIEEPSNTEEPGKTEDNEPIIEVNDSLTESVDITKSEFTETTDMENEQKVNPQTSTEPIENSMEKSADLETTASSDISASSTTSEDDSNSKVDLVYSDIEKALLNEESPTELPKDEDMKLSEASDHTEISPDEKNENAKENSLFSRIFSFAQNILGNDLAIALEAELAEPRMSTGAITLLGIISLTIIICYTIHLLFNKCSRESPLLSHMNAVDKKYRITLAELEKIKANGVATPAGTTPNITITTMNDQIENKETMLQLENSQSECNELKEKINQLEQELEESTNNGLEMHKMLEEMLTSQKDSSAFQDSIDALQSMLDGQREVVGNLTSDLTIKNRLNDELQLELKSTRDKTTKLENQIEQLTRSLEDVNKSKLEISLKLEETMSSTKQLQKTNEELTMCTEKTTEQIDSLNRQIEELTNTVSMQTEALHTKEAELVVSKQCLKQLSCIEDNGKMLSEDKLEKMFDIIKIKSKLHSSEEENEKLKSEINQQQTTSDELKNELKLSREETNNLKDKMSTAMKESEDAKGKLAVLTEYFKDKEAQLTKELESQEGMRLTAEGSAESIAKKIQGLELEVATCRGKISGLQNELEEQEQEHKKQISNYEQKTHEVWLMARSAERKHEGLRQENSQLRQKLNVLHKEKEDQMHLIKPSPNRSNTNGSLSSPVLGPNEEVEELTSPHPMLPLPPLPPFFPPPPYGLPPFMDHPLPPPPPMDDRRMPPAGRMASPPYRWDRSPPLDRRSYSPGSDRSQYSDHHRYSPDHPRRPMHPRRGSQGRPSPSSRSPDRWYNRSPNNFNRNRSPPRGSYSRGNDLEDPRLQPPGRGKDSSPPIGPADR